jgi:vacuolar-type H+-ATPase subunit H
MKPGAYREFGEQLGYILQEAKDRARDMEKRAREHADAILAAAQTETERVNDAIEGSRSAAVKELEEMRETTRLQIDEMRTHAEAEYSEARERTRKLVREAEARAAVILSQAQREAQQIKKGVEADLIEARKRNETESRIRIRKLEQRIGQLQRAEAIMTARLKEGLAK